MCRSLRPGAGDVGVVIRAMTGVDPGPTKPCSELLGANIWLLPSLSLAGMSLRFSISSGLRAAEHASRDSAY
jgi:hypothetical protein